MPKFPWIPERLDVYAALTEGQGDAVMDMVITELATGNEIHMRRLTTRFTNPLTEVHAVFRLRECPFPKPGVYQFALFVDDELLAQRRLSVVQR